MRRKIAQGLTVALAAGMLTLGGTAAGAAPALPWTVQNATPQAPQGSFAAVSCPTVGHCVAVGNHVASDFQRRPLAEIKSGGAWRVTTTPAPAGSQDSKLVGVSCSSASACIAVGSTFNGGPDRAFALRWNGTKWSLLTVPLPSGTRGSDFSAVSCSGPSSCIAVGDRVPQGSQQVTLAERWNGTSWTVTTSPNPNPASRFAAVSCASATFCFAVGDSGHAAQTLGERWNGSTWTVTPTVSSSGHPQLNGVSCTSATACTAVGQEQDPSESDLIAALAERWNGHTWALQATSVNHNNSSLAAVSCPTAAVCFASGTVSDATTNFDNAGPLVMRFSAGSWSTVSDSENGSENSFGISCPSTTTCSAVGTSTDARGDHSIDLAATSGTSFADVPTADPNGPLVSTLESVSCVNATLCWAVGSIAGGRLPLAERLSGGTWSSVPLPPSGLDETDDLAAVSCTGANFCMAVGTGSQVEDGITEAITARWNGSAWSNSFIPSPDGVDTIAGVSCTSATFCVAVGATDDQMLVARWNGTSWADDSVATPAGATFPSLAGVSCTSATTCTAVGSTSDSGGTQRPLIETLHGGTWTPTVLTNVGAAQLNGVSCPTAAVCNAVGSINGSASSGFLIAHLAAGSWAPVTAPSVPGSAFANLTGVSCATTTACTASGWSEPASEQRAPAILRLSGGSWAVSPTPALPRTESGSLAGVSCTSAAACHAVGGFEDFPPAAGSEDTSAPLVEASS